MEVEVRCHASTEKSKSGAFVERYVQVSAGDFHVVWLLSDGTVVAAGDNRYGQCWPKHLRHAKMCSSLERCSPTLAYLPTLPRCSIPSPGDLEYTKATRAAVEIAQHDRAQFTKTRSDPPVFMWLQRQTVVGGCLQYSMSSGSTV